MNWKLVFALSLFGLGMAVGTVFVIPSQVEPVFWLVIFLICAVVIARWLPRRHFIHGLLVGIVNSLWVTAAHTFFFSEYMSNHPKEAAMTKSMPLPPRLMMAIVGPLIGIISGAIIGLLAWGAGKLFKSRAAAAVSE